MNEVNTPIAIVGFLGMVGLFGVLSRDDTRHADGRVRLFNWSMRWAYLILRALVGFAVFLYGWYWAV